ncbi:Protein MioC like protein [Saliniradius amylolyticus]|uniref:Protein MioC like protein n=1 Tax=Saliniradius amylolyticus TaxID=2183582 RepID=A0A2S2E6L8_9ALTE|nr:flavodoxin domain-containing protein [Saliniradius amylolyticus]AWL12617.1 Protein MioC like protein [Saliniradius amylolyticus]
MAQQISVFYGSVYGNAQQVAEEAADTLTALGYRVDLLDDPQVSDFQEAQEVLFISSTTGQGDIPPNLEPFILDLESRFPLLDGRKFAVVALGDSSYGETYCGAGRRIYELMEELMGTPRTQLLEVDAIETLEPTEEVLPWIKQYY